MVINEHFTNLKFIKLSLFIAFPLSLIACGEGTPGSGPVDLVHPKAKFVPLNDTGVTFFIDNQNNVTIDQTNPVAIEQFIEPVLFPGQDASFGADTLNPSASDGVAGFNFTKLDRINGTELAANALDFGCVRDNVTGLYWENKTDPKLSALSDYYKLHDGSATHTWYDPNENTNGGHEGQEAAQGACSSEIIDGDTYNFRKAVNTEKLCGFDDWRIPTSEELRSIVDYSVKNGNHANPMADSIYFKFIATKLHRWTSQTVALLPERAFGFHLHEGRMQAHVKYCTPSTIDQDGNDKNDGSDKSFHNGTVLVRGVY